MILTGSLPKTAIAQLKLQFWKKKLMGFVNHTFRNDYDKVVGGREQAESFHKCLAKDYYGVQYLFLSVGHNPLKMWVNKYKYK